MKKIPYASAIRVSLIYLAFSTLWIVFSDYVLVLFFDDVNQYRNFSTYKGLFFIAVSALIIYYLVRSEVIYIKGMYDKIEVLKNYDTLTHAYNRIKFNEEIERIEEHKINVSIIMSDINGLRLINELYSSQEGDKTLQSYTKILRDTLPKNTHIARIGGDEFCCILYNCNYDRLVKFVQQIEATVKNTKIYDIECSVAVGYSNTSSDMQNIHEALFQAEDRLLKNKLLLKESASNSIITTLKTTLFERSDETEQHASRLKVYCSRIGETLNMRHNEIDELNLLAILHDIGKIGIEDKILKKPGKLTPTEFTKMKQHPVIGYKIASSVPQLEAISYFILTHHERWDGKGYPKGLKGEDIPLASRILAVVDAYDAMTNDRVYRKAMPQSDAIKELVNNKGSQFDPEVTNIFLDLIAKDTFLGIDFDVD